MDDKLTDLVNRRNCSDPDVRNQAAQKVVDAFDDQLIVLVREQLDDARILQRVDAEDVVQSVYRSFFGRDNALPSRNAIFVFLRTMATHKAINLRKYHAAQKRDVRREVADPHGVPDESTGNEPIEVGKKRGRKEPQMVCADLLKESPKRQYELDRDSLSPVDSAIYDVIDSDVIEMMTDGAKREHADTFLSLVELLRVHDQKKGDNLETIVKYSLGGLGRKEIAKSMETSRKTVERKLKLAGDIMWEAKTARIHTSGETGDFKTVVVSRNHTARDILHHHGYEIEAHELRLEDEQQQSVRVFKNDENVHSRIETGAVLAATPLQSEAGDSKPTPDSR